MKPLHKIRAHLGERGSSFVELDGKRLDHVTGFKVETQAEDKMFHRVTIQLLCDSIDLELEGVEVET